jgi:OmpA-OmpF porin, OOP family
VNRRSRKTATCLGAAALLLAPARAAAQASTFYLDRLQIAGAPDDGLAVWRPVVGPTRFFAQLGAGYARNPLRASNLAGSAQADALGGPPVAAQITTYLTAGTEIDGRAAVQITLPVTVFQRGSPTDSAAAGLPQAVSLAPAAPADLRVDGRIMLAEAGAGLFKIAARGAAFLPTGDARSFTGEGAVWGNVALAAELDVRAVFVTANLGVTVRDTTTLGHLTVGPEMTYGLAAYVPLARGRVRLGAEVFGSAGLVSGSDGAPLEGSLQGRVFFDEGRTAWLGAGAGGRFSAGIAPDGRAALVVGGAFGLRKAVDAAAHPPPKPPEVPATDTDHDGVPDLLDGCPEVPGTQEDGCPVPPPPPPEPDTDGDGIPDSADKCPREPGFPSDDPAMNGCPQFIRRVADHVQLSQEIEFETGRTAIRPKSFPMLDEVVKLLQANPDIARLDIEGHTDNVGSDAVNLAISQARAAAVREYLFKHGIDAARLTSQGYGALVPVAPNDTAEGRAKNRRVELHIIQRARKGR